MSAYYNEIDPYAAQWLRNLIAAGHIAPGAVDERSIIDVRSEDIKGFTQCHFFAGIGGWSLALRLSLWPDDRHVWTGSCPCQPFSAAGKGEAADDERHLWPAWFSLIRECRPTVVFGEQVEAAIGWGWLDAVFADLEAEGYACGAAVLPACGVGAPHIRQRLWFVGHAEQRGLGRDAGAGIEAQGGIGLRSGRIDAGSSGSDAGELADADAARRGAGRPGEAGDDGASWIEPSGLRADGMGYSGTSGLSPRECQEFSGAQQFSKRRTIEQSSCSPWSDLVWLPCTDGKARPTQSGIFPLVNGVSARVGKLRAAGNAIVPQVAAEFIRARSNS